MSVVKKCVCDHDFQDKVYGLKKRVFNPTQKGVKQGYRCTVCRKEQ